MKAKKITYKYIEQIEKEIKTIENELKNSNDLNEWVYLAKSLTAKENHLEAILDYLGSEYVGAMSQNNKLRAYIPAYL